MPFCLYALLSILKCIHLFAKESIDADINAGGNKGGDEEHHECDQGYLFRIAD